jgi:Toprim domain
LEYEGIQVTYSPMPILTITEKTSQARDLRAALAIAGALKRCNRVILATDCDREGQLIGQEILEHLHYRGTVQRALFTAQDPKSLRQAFDKLKPNREPALRGCRRTPAGRPDLQFVADPHGDQDAARPPASRASSASAG